ncbi:hypothetical protein [Ralstonia sp. 3PA37C10]|uniref:hypothetical protein n=1 Tax=Ralstonia sp. 3PA37C10 TaxID=2502217 RepID=UPI0020183B7A|nr:hypothetical protein [Ralstonia sp. 3PA37C10]
MARDNDIPQHRLPVFDSQCHFQLATESIATNFDTQGEIMNSQATTRPDLSAAWTVIRHIAFWGGWAFRMLIVVPSVAFCLLLAVYSDFSFSTIPQEVLQRIADTAKYPAAPDGYVTMRTCKDSKPAVKDLAPQVACKTFGFEQQSIAESALAAGQNLATMYCIFVLLGFGWVLTVGSFTSSRHAFRASLQKGRQAKVAR